MEIYGSLLKFEDNKIWRFGKRNRNSKEKWYVLKGTFHTNNKTGYKSHNTKINYKYYSTARLIYKLHNPNWDINDNSKNNTIDHISRDSLDNRIINLRIATMLEQNLNKDWVINAKGYCFNKGIWQAYINIDGKRKHLGCFVLESEARNAYLSAVQERNIII